MNISTRHILAMARTGSPVRAWRMFVDAGFDDRYDDPKILTLKGRLLKDQAKAGQGDEQRRLYALAARAYQDASAIEPASYPLINAATLMLLSGDAGQSRNLAQQVLDMLDANPNEAETRYWLGATRSEALLLLGDMPAAQSALDDAINQLPHAWEDHAATIGQFKLICSILNLDAGWLNVYQPPRSMHFQGIMSPSGDHAALRARIDDWLAKENIGFGYGALAAGADIIIAEALIARGGILHVILPCDIENFRNQSIAAFNHDWAQRFDALIEQADTLEILDEAQAPVAAAVSLCDMVCMGLARQNAMTLQSEALVLRIDYDEGRAEKRLAEWAQSGGRFQIIQSSEATQAMPDNHDQASHETSALLAIHHGENILDIDIDAAVTRYPILGGVILRFPTLDAAWAAYQSVVASCDDAAVYPMALDHGIVTQPPQQSMLYLRAQALLEISENGTLLASKAAAFPMLSKQQELHVEAMGEIRATIGMFPAYRIISSN